MTLRYATAALLAVLAVLAAPVPVTAQTPISPTPPAPPMMLPGSGSVALTMSGAVVCSRAPDARTNTLSAYCWGRGPAGALGIPGAAPLGAPGDLGPVNIGGASPMAIRTGGRHTCAQPAEDFLRCWGQNTHGQLGLGNTQTIGDDEAPATAAVTDIPRPTVDIALGDNHTCVILPDSTVRCWGLGARGQLGYANTATIGDDEPAGSAGPVDLGAGRTARAISAGGDTTCALLDDGTVRCWGAGGAKLGQGTGSTSPIGDDETPGSVPVINLGAGRTTTQISVGQDHACALLDDRTIRCWGDAGSLTGLTRPGNPSARGSSTGRLGYGTTQDIGDDETPAAAGPVNLGAGRTATAVAAGTSSTCALLDNATVRCWGGNTDGELGYGNTRSIGDTETPATASPVELGQTATAIAVGDRAACATLAGGDLACWGYGGSGQLGNRSTDTIGDDESPRTSRVSFTAAPTAGQRVETGVVSGTVFVQPPGKPRRQLQAGESLPNGTVVDATAGRVLITTADGRGSVQRAEFYDGTFRITQNRRTALATMTLVGKLSCPRSKARRSVIATGRPAAKRKARPLRTRRVWGKGKGRFRIDGRRATASVKGTTWLVEDHCTGTLVRVTDGKITVRDKVRRKTLTLRAGQQRFFPNNKTSKPTRKAR